MIATLIGSKSIARSLNLARQATHPKRERPLASRFLVRFPNVPPFTLYAMRPALRLSPQTLSAAVLQRQRAPFALRPAPYAMLSALCALRPALCEYK